MAQRMHRGSPDIAAADVSDFDHVGPDTLAGRYLRRFWHPVCMAREVAPGKARAIRVLGEDFTVYRGEGGAPHVVDFRCAHRRAQLWAGWVEGDCIRCLYHGWKYDGTGQCVEQPAEDPRLAEKTRIAGYPTQDYLGLIFAYLGPGEAPPMPRYSAFERPGIAFRHVSFTGEYSYFQNLENLVDPVHAVFTHRSFFDRTGAAMAPVKLERSSWGITISRAGIGQGVSQFGMPNVFQIGGALATPGALSVVWVVPIEDGKHRFYSVRASTDPADVAGGDGASDSAARCPDPHPHDRRAQHRGLRAHAQPAAFPAPAGSARAGIAGRDRRPQQGAARPVGSGHRPPAPVVAGRAESPGRRRAADAVGVDAGNRENG